MLPDIHQSAHYGNPARMLFDRKSMENTAGQVTRSDDPRMAFAAVAREALASGNVRGLANVLALVHAFGGPTATLHADWVALMDASWPGRSPPPVRLASHVKFRNLPPAAADGAPPPFEDQEAVPCLPILNHRATGSAKVMATLLGRPELIRQMLALHRRDSIADPRAKAEYEARVDLVQADWLGFLCGQHLSWSPFHARLLTSREAIVLPGDLADCNAARFDDVEPFYLIKGSAFMTAAAVLFPYRGVCWLFGTESNQAARLQNAAAGIMQHEAQRQPPQADAAPPLPALVLPHGNLGHHVWNAVGGIATLVAAGYRLPVLDLERTPFIGVDDLFPGAGLTRLRGAEAREACNSGRYTPFSFIDFFLDGTEFLEVLDADVAAIPRNDRFRLWLGIRGGSRRWRNLNACAKATVERLLAAGVAVELIIDGHTADPAGQIDVSRAFQEELEMVQGLDAALEGRVTVTSLVGATARQKLAHAALVDCFVEIFSSGNCWNSWLRNKPGLYIASTAIPGFGRNIYAATRDAACRVYAAPEAVRQHGEHYNAALELYPEYMADFVMDFRRGRAAPPAA